MARWRGTTTARGYGHPHRAERQLRLAAYKPGDLCAHGGEPLRYPPPRLIQDRHGTRLASPHLDLPHLPDRSGYLPGLSCRRHNRADGAIRKNRKHASGRRRPRPALAKPAPDGESRRCPYCGELANRRADRPEPDACGQPICQVASRQATRMAQADGLPIGDARAAMAAKVRQARQRR